MATPLLGRSCVDHVYVPAQCEPTRDAISSQHVLLVLPCSFVSHFSAFV